MGLSFDSENQAGGARMGLGGGANQTQAALNFARVSSRWTGSSRLCGAAQMQGPGNWKHPPLAGGPFPDSVGVRKPVGLFQGGFGCATERMGHGLWRHTARVHRPEPQFPHL